VGAPEVEDAAAGGCTFVLKASCDYPTFVRTFVTRIRSGMGHQFDSADNGSS
jgi:hypothetical protein